MPVVDTAFERLSTCVAEMRESITRTRMQRIDGLFSALPRMVRDLSAELSKQVLLVIDGGDVELDREMIEMIRDPLTHIVRNAIDHGIEDADDRARAGKPIAGTLRVDARQSGNQILIEVADDGRGIDDARLVQKAITAGILTPERAATMTRTERLELVFAAGLSTASQVTAISGRGVGMDVVRANVERIGGTVEIDTQVGRGCRLTLRVPMTLTIIPALTFSVGSELFAIPRGAIDEIVRSAGGSVQVETVGSSTVARIRGDRVPVVELAKLLGLDSYVGRARAILVVVRASSGERYALSVDSVQDHEELVVKPAAPAIMATGIYAGTTLPDNGRPMLLIDPVGVAHVAGVRAPEAAIPAQTADQGDEKAARRADLAVPRGRSRGSGDPAEPGRAHRRCRGGRGGARRWAPAPLARRAHRAVVRLRGGRARQGWPHPRAAARRWRERDRLCDRRRDRHPRSVARTGARGRARPDRRRDAGG